MDIKWRRFSHSLSAKVIAFSIAIVCFTSVITTYLNLVEAKNADLGLAFEKSYYLSSDYRNTVGDIKHSLMRIVQTYKSEDNILNGSVIANSEIQDREEELYQDFKRNSHDYDSNLSDAENYAVFKKVKAEQIAQIRDNLIKAELQEYKSILSSLGNYRGLFYYAKEGEIEFTNSSNKDKDYFKSFPAYLISDPSEQTVFPEEMEKDSSYNMARFRNPDKLYLAFSQEFLNSRMTEWAQNKAAVTEDLHRIGWSLLGLGLAFSYLVLIIGRKPEKDQEIRWNFIDRIYNDVKVVICLILIFLWAMTTYEMYHCYNCNFQLLFIITLLIASCGLIFVLSLIKQIKNKTLLRHSLLFILGAKIAHFIKEIYDSGSVGVKVVLIVIGYPVLVALTFFMFPITIGAAAWIALKKVKAFNAIKEGVRKVKDGDLHYTIDISGDGEFGRLASDINSITDGLKKSVANEIKSERLKTELITNVSHDIRTPLTSIITYVDLVKKETDQTKVKQYMEIIDQKSQRLKILTEDLFEAAKASSGSIPVNFEKIDLKSLITQGLGELDDKIQECKLEFKMNSPKESVYLQADGRLLWRAMENLFSNIFKYALKGSRVYIDILERDAGVMLIIKNISAYELNISSDELMERFTRGDKSRSSQGSGLGLSIAKSLIELQKGSFDIEIDGDLFKAVIQMPKYN